MAHRKNIYRTFRYKERQKHKATPGYRDKTSRLNKYAMRSFFTGSRVRNSGLGDQQ